MKAFPTPPNVIHDDDVMIPSKMDLPQGIMLPWRHDKLRICKLPALARLMGARLTRLAASWISSCMATMRAK